MAKQLNLSEAEITLLKAVYDDCDKEDISVRERQIRQWRRLKLLWEGFQHVWYSEVAHDWRIADDGLNGSTDQASYDKPINVFKAYLETIIAALSITIPPIKCYPDDADNTLDLATAKAGDKIGQLVYRHNEVSLLWLHALFILATEGMIACYSYPKQDEKFGTYEKKEHEEVEEEHEQTICSKCGYILDDKLIQSNTNPSDLSDSPTLPNQMSGTNPMEMQQPIKPQTTLNMNPSSNSDSDQLKKNEIDEFMPDDEDAPLHNALSEEQDLCPACMQQMDPSIQRNKLIVTRLVGVTTEPKTRMCMEVYGGLYVKVPNFAKCQEEIPYLIYSHEIDYSMAIERFERLKGKRRESLIKKIESGNNAGSYNQYAQWGRLSPQYQGEYPLNVVTINEAWIRPAKFNILYEQSDIDKLRKRFPDGVKVTFVNDEFACAENEALDDCWTLSQNPLADFIHFDPIGQGLVSIQEITNDLISLVLQTIEHGIGQTFADPAVVNFKAYETTEVVPGGIFPATPKSGKSLNDGFHELKTATLSGEVLPFYQSVQSMGQLTSGALPSLFGGQIQGAETASQYSMSRAQALQRLQNTWKMMTSFWKNIFGKVIPMFIDELQDDERDVQQDKDGNFFNAFIRKADLEGRIGRVELEANENLPMTWGQTKDTIEKLMLAGNEQINKILYAPENIALIHEYLGLSDFYVPGEDDIIKQYDEIKVLLNSTPIPTADPNMPEVSSVDIDPLYDNHPIEFEIVRKWAISEIGRQAKEDNPDGYRNVLLHGKLHFMQIQMSQQQQQVPQEKGAVPAEKPNENLEAPITGESNVNSVH